MENNNLNTTIKNNEIVNAHSVASSNGASTNRVKINIREILFKYFQKLHWFIISIAVCVGIAYFYVKTTHKQYQVQSTILLRKDQSSKGLVDMSMLEGLSISTTPSKEVEDEIQVLTSKSLMRNMIESLNIQTEYFVKDGLMYNEMYPIIPIKLVVPSTFNDTLKNQVELKLKKSKKGYEVKFKYGKIEDVYEISEINKPFKTPVGILSFQQMTLLNVIVLL